jgi:hypothetical protein
MVYTQSVYAFTISNVKLIIILDPYEAKLNSLNFGVDPYIKFYRNPFIIFKVCILLREYNQYISISTICM